MYIVLAIAKMLFDLRYKIRVKDISNLITCKLFDHKIKYLRYSKIDLVLKNDIRSYFGRGKYRYII